MYACVQQNSTYSDACYQDLQLSRSGKFVENSTKLTCLEIGRYQIKFSSMLWALELQIRRDRKV